MNAKLAERSLLQFAIGRVIFDGLGIAAKSVALMQHRRVTVGEARALVEMTAGQPAEAIEMRLDMAKQGFRQMQEQQVGQRRVGPIKVHPGGIRSEQARLAGGGNLAVVLEWLHFLPLVRSALSCSSTDKAGDHAVNNHNWRIPP